jgi:Ca2+-binding EF-hand superfamily protein
VTATLATPGSSSTAHDPPQAAYRHVALSGYRFPGYGDASLMGLRRNDMRRALSLPVLAAVLPILALVALPASAQNNNRVPVPLGSKDPPPVGPTPPVLVVEPVAMMIATFDMDGDGKVTRDEMHKGVAKSFAAIDTGNTGKLGYIAFADWAERWLGNATALPGPFEVDTDGDNQITLAELQARFDAIFTRLDVNKDNVLVRAELLTIRADVNRGYDRRDKRGTP